MAQTDITIETIFSEKCAYYPLKFFTMSDASNARTSLRLVSKEMLMNIENCPWRNSTEAPFDQSVIFGSTADWKKCFPYAQSANLRGRKTLTDADVAPLNGVPYVVLRYCDKLTDEAFPHLVGVQELDITGLTKLTDKAFLSLKGIKKLNMSYCDKGISDAAFENLAGVESLDMSHCCQPGITIAALKHVRGAKHLNIHGCNKDKFAQAGLEELGPGKAFDTLQCYYFSKEFIAAASKVAMNVMG